MSEGAPLRRNFRLTSGTFTTTTRDPANGEVVMNRLRPGAVFELDELGAHSMRNMIEPADRNDGVAAEWCRPTEPSSPNKDPRKGW